MLPIYNMGIIDTLILSVSLSLHYYHVCLFELFEIDSCQCPEFHYVVSLELKTILLPQPLECWYYMHYNTIYAHIGHYTIYLNLAPFHYFPPYSIFQLYMSSKTVVFCLVGLVFLSHGFSM